MESMPLMWALALPKICIPIIYNITCLDQTGHTLLSTTILTTKVTPLLLHCPCRLISVLESMDNGKTIRESRDCDIPLVARHFYHHSGTYDTLP